MLKKMIEQILKENKTDNIEKERIKTHLRRNINEAETRSCRRFRKILQRSVTSDL